MQRMTPAAAATRRRNSQPVMTMSAQSPVMLNTRPSSGRYLPSYRAASNDVLPGGGVAFNPANSGSREQMAYQQAASGRLSADGSGEMLAPLSRGLHGHHGDSGPTETMRYSLTTRGMQEPFNITIGGGGGKASPMPVIRLDHSVPGTSSGMMGNDGNMRAFVVDSDGRNFHYVNPHLPPHHPHHHHPSSRQMQSPSPGMSQTQHPRMPSSPLPTIVEGGGPTYHPISSPPPYPGKGGGVFAQQQQPGVSGGSLPIERLGSPYSTQRPLSPRLSPVTGRHDILPSRTSVTPSPSVHPGAAASADRFSPSPYATGPAIGKLNTVFEHLLTLYLVQIKYLI